MLTLLLSPGVGVEVTSVSCLMFDGRTVENKGKLILTEIFPSVQKHDI